MTNEHNTPPVAAPAPAEPFGYFRVDALGWTDCAATDEGAIALYERPAAPAVPNVMKRGYGRLIQAAADLALQQFMPSDIVDDYPSKTISAAKVAKMMTQPRDRLRLLSIEVSEGAKQMLAATPATPSQEHAVNLSCRSTQARLAAQWGYVPAPSQPAVPGVEMPLSMNQFGRLVELTREHLSDNTFVYKATSKTGDTCHFGVESAAKAWAKGGTVEAIKVREFKLHTPPAAPSQPAVPQGEPVYQLAGATGPVADAWIDVAKDVYDDAGFHPSDFKRRILYAAPSQPVNRPQNCGTSFCSCIECVCEPEQVTLTDAVKALDDLQSAFMSHTQWNGTPPSEVIAARAIIAALREKEALR